MAPKGVVTVMDRKGRVAHAVQKKADEKHLSASLPPGRMQPETGPYVCPFRITFPSYVSLYENANRC